MFYGRSCKRPHCSWHQLANSSQQPTRGRSLARRFRASFCATLTRREPRAVRPRAAERKNVGPTTLFIASFARIAYEVLPAAPLPSAGLCAQRRPNFALQRSAPVRARARDGPPGPALARATLPRPSLLGKSHITLGA